MIGAEENGAKGDEMVKGSGDAVEKVEKVSLDNLCCELTLISVTAGRLRACWPY